jgi:methanogenic corrinoid protein MtbC1
LVAGRALDIVGLTVSVERHATPLTRTIASVRRASRNPGILVLVGGRVFTDRPGLATEIGADGTAADGQLAVTLAETLLTKRLALGVVQDGV